MDRGNWVILPKKTCPFPLANRTLIMSTLISSSAGYCVSTSHWSFCKLHIFSPFSPLSASQRRWPNLDTSFCKCTFTVAFMESGCEGWFLFTLNPSTQGDELGLCTMWLFNAPDWILHSLHNWPWIYSTMKLIILWNKKIDRGNVYMCVKWLEVNLIFHFLTVCWYHKWHSHHFIMCKY